MSMPGWYPDPAGTPDRFRYWDGRAWSTDTTDDPTAGPPVGGAGASGPPGTGGARRRMGPLFLILALVIVLVVAGILVVRGLVADRPIVDPEPLPSSTVSGWDDSSPTTAPETPTPSPSEPQPTPTPTPTPEPTDEQPVQPCPEGQPSARQDHPSDGRVYGGDLSFPEVAGWRNSSGVSFSWAYDVAEQRKMAESPSWYSNLAVGALFTGDGFDEPRRAAELVMQCVITSGLYPHLTDRRDIWSKAVTVDGHSAWSVRADIEIDDPELDAKGDTVEVIVVDTGSPESLSMFIGAANTGDEPLQRTLDTTITELRVG